MKVPAWLLIASILLALSAVLILAPFGFEGPKLLRIARGHAVTGMDLVALAPLTAAGLVTLAGQSPRWQRLRELRSVPLLGLFGTGLALGLAIATRFPYLLINWPLAAAILVLMAIIAAISLFPR